MFALEKSFSLLESLVSEAVPRNSRKMRASQARWYRFPIVLSAIVVGGLFCSDAPADTFISGYEGDFGSSIGLEWNPIGDPANADFAFVDDRGVTQGLEALEVTHNTGWTHSLQLDGGQLMELVANSDTFELDVTVDGFNTSWRQLFFVMQGNGLGWSQVGIDLDAGTGFDPYVTTNVSIDLADPNGDGSANWKQAAIDSLPDVENTWWQIHLIFQGQDLTGESRVATVIDNLRFVGGPDADFNDDTVIDGDDLALWQSDYGADVDGIADADGDGDSDGSDYLAWQQQFTGATPAVGAVPEPSTLAMLVAAIGLSAARIRR